MFEIKGSDFDDGVITAGDELICEYEVLDSGNIMMEVSVSSIGGSFHSGRNFYSRQDGQIDYTKASKHIEDESEHTLQRLEEMATQIDDDRLDQAREKLEQAESTGSSELDPEIAKQAMDSVQEAKRLLALARKDHLKDIRQFELKKTVEFFDSDVREYARASEETVFDNLAKTAQRSIESNSGDFESHLSELRSKNFLILWRQDWFVIDRFKGFAEATYLFPDARAHAELIANGQEAMRADDMERLRTIVMNLYSIRIGSTEEDDLMASANIVRG
jgi:molecular chaperone DnaK